MLGRQLGRFRRGGAHGHQLGRFVDVEARTAISSDVFTSRSTSILRPIRSQFYVQFDLNFTSNSTSILRPMRSQFYVKFDTNGATFFCRRYEAGGDMKLPLATVFFSETVVTLPCLLLDMIARCQLLQKHQKLIKRWRNVTSLAQPSVCNWALSQFTEIADRESMLGPLPKANCRLRCMAPD